VAHGWFERLHTRWGRWRRSRGRSAAQLVFSTAYSVELPTPLIDAQRAQRILGHLAACGAVGAGQVHTPRAASFAQLCRVHTEEYLESLQEPGSTVPILGFDLTDAVQDEFLASQRRAVGGTVLAAQLASSRNGVAVNLAGGLHHALPDRGQGNCAFNDVAVAVTECRRRGFQQPILVIDLDLHDGDGTRALFAGDSSVHTYSLHNRHLGRIDAVESTGIELGDDVADERYLEVLRETLPALVERFSPALAFYLAGCDVARDDPLGNWQISAAGMLARDRFVIEQLRRGSQLLPGVVLLGGGYGQASWRYSARFLTWLLTGSAAPDPPQTLDLALTEYRRIGRLLTVPELTADPAGGDWTLSEGDLFQAAPRQTRLLGFYSRHGLELALQHYGLLDRLRAMGFRNLWLGFDLDDPAGQTVRLFSDADRSDLLMELRVRRDRTRLPDAELLAVEWLLLQNPRDRFSADRPRLPGQEHPGLGLLREVTSLLVLACERLHLDGLSVVPAHYHIAALAHGLFRFADPLDEGRFLALVRLFAPLRLYEAVRALEQGRVIERSSGERFHWPPRPLVLPVSAALKDRLDSDDYNAATQDAARSFDFVLSK